MGEEEHQGDVIRRREMAPAWESGNLGQVPAALLSNYVTSLEHVLSVPLASVSPSVQEVRESVLL